METESGKANIKEIDFQKTISEVELLLDHLRQAPPSEIPNKAKVRVNNLFEKCGYLTAYWDFTIKRGNLTSRINESMWNGNLMLQYLFEHCITNFKSKNDVCELYCGVCKERFPSSSESLHEHVTKPSHLAHFNDDRNQQMTKLWNDLDLERLAYEPFLIFTNAMTIHCKLCGIEIPMNYIELFTHVNNDTHIGNFNELFKFKFGQIESHKPSETIRSEQSARSNDLGDINSSKNGVSFNSNISDKSTKQTDNMVPIKDEAEEKAKHEKRMEFDKHVTDMCKMVLLNPEITKEERQFYGLYCNPCGFWTLDRELWCTHLKSDNHKANMLDKPNCTTVVCECYILVVCDMEFLDDHKLRVGHKRLKQFFQKKLNLKPKESSNRVKSNDSVVNDSLDEPQSLDESDESDLSTSESSESESSNEASTYSAQSKDRSYKHHSRHRRNNTAQYQKLSTQKSYHWFGLKGLPSDITEKEISEGLQRIGEVECFEQLENNDFNLLINLRRELQGHEDSIKNSVRIDIRGCKYLILGKFFVNFLINTDVANSLTSNYDEFVDNIIKYATKRQELLSFLFNKFEENICKIYSHITFIDLFGCQALGIAQSGDIVNIYLKIDDLNIDLRDSHHIRLIETHNKELFEALKSTMVDVEIKDGHITGRHGGFPYKLFITDSLVIEKKKLIQSYLSAFENLRPLVMLVKFWVVKAGLSDCISNYAVLWLVLFYLMQRDIGLLKPVSTLRYNCDNIKTVSGWECGFCKVDPSNLKTSSMEFNIKTMLEGFFEYFGKHPFFNRVICPLVGGLVKHGDFHHLNFKSRSFSNYIHNCQKNKDNALPISNGITLQDPLQLNMNLTPNLKGYKLSKFRQLCKNTVDILRNFRTTNC